MDNIKKFTKEQVLKFKEIVTEIHPEMDALTGLPAKPTSVDPTAVAQNPALFKHFEAYEELFMQLVYEQVEEDTGLFLEVSVRNHKGEVNALTDGGNPGCKTVATWRYEDEIEAMFKILIKNCVGTFVDDMLLESFEAAVDTIKEWIGQ